MYVQADDVKEKIPISESVRKLEEAFPHLRDVKWNEKADLTARARKHKLESKKNVKVSE